MTNTHSLRSSACEHIQVSSSTWWGFQILQNSSKNMAQNVTHSPWGETEGPRLCLMAKLLEKIHKSPLHYKEIKPVGLIGRTDAEAEAPILWPPDAKN